MKEISYCHKSDPVNKEKKLVKLNPPHTDYTETLISIRGSEWAYLFRLLEVPLLVYSLESIWEVEHFLREWSSFRRASMLTHGTAVGPAHL